MLNIMTKRILIITGIAVALLAVGATATYLALKQEIERAKLEQPAVTTPEEPAVQPEEPTTTEPIDTSDWETYRNEEFGFEIRFPRILLDLKRTYSTRVVGGINFRLSTQPLSDPFERYQFYGRKGYQYVQPNPCTPLEEGEHTEKNIGGVRFIRTEIKPSPGTRGLLAIEIH